MKRTLLEEGPLGAGVTWLSRKRGGFHRALYFVLVAAIGVADTLTGYEASSSLFYLLPVFQATWFGGKALGMESALVGALAWSAADHFSGHPYSSTWIPYWNAGIRLSIFLLVALLLGALREAYRREKTLARQDPVTGVANGRFFFEILRREIDRSTRYGRPITVAYMDLDNFKEVNDRFGHSKGDDVLRTVAQTASHRLRSVDTVARLGGDEFCLLLPETGPEQAPKVLESFRKRLLAVLGEAGWPVTVSVGAVTCAGIPVYPDELIGAADRVMYRVKREGKNGILCVRYEDVAGEATAGGRNSGGTP